MRWFWIDRFEEFERCRHASAVKCVTLAEEHLHDHMPGCPVMPNSLVLEAMAQTAGLLVADALDFKLQVVLAKVSRSEFRFDVVPGDVLRIRAEIVEIGEQGSMAAVTTSVEAREQAAAELVFGHVESGRDVPVLFSRDEMLRWLDQTGIFAVARNPDGTSAVRGRV